MKLKSIAESDTYHKMWRRHTDEISSEQSAKNLIVSSLNKIRNMLGPMRLTKNPIQKHRVTEPIDQAIAPFDNLRRVVREKTQADAQMLINGQGDREKIGQFWGIQLPTNYYDVYAGQNGRVNANGKFDDLIRQTIAASNGKPIELKIELLNRLAEVLMAI